MKKNIDFMEGKLTYTVARMTPEELATVVAGIWANGYVAFANTEKHLGDLNGIGLDARFLSERVQGVVNGAEGYVMEVDLWRKTGNIIEEVAAEREETTYYVQHWRLDTTPAPGSGDCWYREADTRPGSHHSHGKRIFADSLKSIEVVWPLERLNFYLSAEGI